MKVVYLACPVGAPTVEGIHENLRKAKAWVGWAAHQGVSPVASYIPLAEALLAGGAETADARAMGIACDMAVLAKCDLVWLCGERISAGMRAEAIEALRLDIPVFQVFNRLPFVRPIYWVNMDWVPE